LKTYTGEVVQILGESKVTLNYGKHKQQLVVYVVNGNGPNLMGRDSPIFIGWVNQIDGLRFYKNMKVFLQKGLEPSQGVKLLFMSIHR